MASPCFICHGTAFDQITPQYQRCRQCGHETLVATGAQAYMLNDPLSAEDTRRVSFLDRFQDAVLDRFRGGAESGQWIDIGSGSGKLLYRNRHKFAQARGVEVTPAAIEFSRRELGLDIVTDLNQVPGGIAFATAWHSLEHFPVEALESLLATLRAKMPAGARIIVSVPNGASFQYRLFHGHFAFFDVPNHLQQFTPDSLQRLFAAHGFSPARPVVSWPYNIFGYAQALLNLVMPGHNYMYYRLKRGAPSKSMRRDLAGFCLLPLVVPLGLVLSLFDAVCPGGQAVLTCCFERGAGGRGALETPGHRPPSGG